MVRDVSDGIRICDENEYGDCAVEWASDTGQPTLGVYQTNELLAMFALLLWRWPFQRVMLLAQFSARLVST